MRGGGRLLSSNRKGFTLAEGATHVAMLNSQRRFGFTLAEVLVTLGIIGVVSAMTVPTLMQNYQRKSYVTQLHKVYNELSQALVRYQTDKNAVNLTEAGLSSQDNFNYFVSDYFKIVQKCDNSLTPCFDDNYKTLNGGGVNFSNGTSYVLASGSAIRFIVSVSGDKIGQVGLDINGQKGPNILGRDLFFIAVYKDGVLDDFNGGSASLTEEQRNSIYTSDCQGSGNVSGWGCFGKILNDNWEMTY